VTRQCWNVRLRSMLGQENKTRCVWIFVIKIFKIKQIIFGNM
jgi:hypothetical protein